MASPTVTDAFDALIRRHQAGVWRYLRALGATVDEADDLTQDVFVSVHDRLDRLADGTSAGAFLRRIARDRLVDLRRAQARWTRRLATRAAELDAAWSDADDADDGGPWLAALRQCVDQLNGRARDAVDGFYRGGESRAALAARLGMREGSVKSLLSRTRAALRQCVERRVKRCER